MSIQTAFPGVVLPSLTPATSSRRRPRRLMVRAKGPFFCGFVMLNAFMWMSFRLLYFLLDSTGDVLVTSTTLDDFFSLRTLLGVICPSLRNILLCRQRSCDQEKKYNHFVDSRRLVVFLGGFVDHRDSMGAPFMPLQVKHYDDKAAVVAQGFWKKPG
ncbi:hypothetical protein C4D60_Mb08t26120 [Musa balbisiana]|uniref:Uncharacterized protein n=1 Tax=Musa balbisiana TaxID=52838 RepID=A0A4S8K6K8_MUSBA|nr:hypothetical protein C4D60_Mb08t26120 [Musa balbisiana]